MANHPRSAFEEAADLPRRSWFGRWIRRQQGRPLDEELSPQDAGNPRAFIQNTQGSGNFGRWTLDDAGLPAYEYTLDQRVKPIALYPNTEKRERRDHWHQVGNHRITALASNDGTVQVYLCDRGGVFLNRFEAYEARPFDLLTVLAKIAFWLLRLLQRLMQPPTAASAQIAPLDAHETVVEKQVARGKVTPRGAPSLEMMKTVAQRQAAGDDASAPPPAWFDAPPKPKPAPRPARPAYAGGYSYLETGGEAWATAYRYGPNTAQTRRLFGMGYFETETTYRGVQVIRRIYAPYGDQSLLLVDIRLENQGATAIDLRHHEFWDVNVHQLKLEWVRSGAFAAEGDDLRRALNANFSCDIAWLPNRNLLRCRQALVEPPPEGALPPDDPCETDWSPAQVFLADLSGTPNAHYFRREKFFGIGGVEQPDAARQRAASDPDSGNAEDDRMPFCLVLRRDLRLEPNQPQQLRYAYGVARPDTTFDFLDAYMLASAPPLHGMERGPGGEVNTPDIFNAMREAWKNDLAYFWTGDDPILQREMAWHSYNLLSAVVYSAYHNLHLVPQGSAYLYLHGADGVPRDQALFTLPMSYLNPAFARNMLILIMRLTNGHTGQIPYSFNGHGSVSDAYGIHGKPSDIDLFFLLALTEYLSASGDMALLDEEVPFYASDKPLRAPGITVLDHIHFALTHLFALPPLTDGIGIGDHQLLKVGSGDWSDSIVFQTAAEAVQKRNFEVAYFNSRTNGESIPNTQMALYVLPLIKAILKDRAPAITQIIDDHLPILRAGVAGQWNANGWYNRAVLRNLLNEPFTLARLDLEAQVWAFISRQAQEEGREDSLIGRVEADLDTPSLIGAAMVRRGPVWPAVSQLLTWGYVRAGRSDLAWRSLNRNTFAAHAREYPDIWFNIWSGPDGINGLDDGFPGGSWHSPMTPMCDFPVMNANQDAMALLALLRVCGVEPAPGGDGLTINPRVPRQRFVLEMPLLRLEVEPGRIAGEYRALFDPNDRQTRSINLYIHLPGRSAPEVISLSVKSGDKVPFEVRTS